LTRPNRFDPFGKRDFEWYTPVYQRPHQGPTPVPGGGDIWGETWWIHFDPVAKPYQRPGQPCCWGIMFDGKYAQAETWWVTNDWKSMVHELTHIRDDLYPAYKDYHSEATSYMAPCKTKGAAECLADVIQSDLALAYKTRGSRDAFNRDCQEYGGEDPTGMTCAKAQVYEVLFLLYYGIAEARIGLCFLK